LLENKLKQSDTEKIAGIAKIAASQSRKPLLGG
jgi:hypothetical protein